MNRRLIILRHAKSAWNTDAPTDHDRPLNKRGRRDAPRIGERIKEMSWTPEQVYSSDSQRTRETWQRMKDALGAGDLEVSFTRDLYHADIEEVRQVLADTPDSVSTVMVIGHNPGWENVVSILSGDDERMTTCNAAMMTIDAESWKNAGAMDGCWELQHLLRPKEL